MNRKQYSKDHWIKSSDTAYALQAYIGQQNKAYSRIKNRFIKELLGDMKEKHFLDYGCGAGMFVVHAAQKGAFKIIGVDAEETVLSTARFFAAREGVADRCTFLVSEQFPDFSPPALFHTILLKDVVEHVEDDESMLLSASQALTRDGILVLSTQNALSLNYLIEGGYHRLIKGEKDWYGWDETHLRFYTPRSLSQKLRGAGLKPIAWRSAYIIPHKFPAPTSSGRQFYRLESLALIDRALGRVFPWNLLGWSIMVKAVRNAHQHIFFKTG